MKLVQYGELFQPVFCACARATIFRIQIANNTTECPRPPCDSCARSIA